MERFSMVVKPGSANIGAALGLAPAVTLIATIGAKLNCWSWLASPTVPPSRCRPQQNPLGVENTGAVEGNCGCNTL